MFQPAPALTFDNARTMLEAGLQAIAAGQSSIDLAGLKNVDSAAVATLLEWRRAAHRHNVPLAFLNTPASLDSLLQLYGVTELVDAAPAAR